MEKSYKMQQTNYHYRKEAKSLNTVLTYNVHFIPNDKSESSLFIENSLVNLLLATTYSEALEFKINDSAVTFLCHLSQLSIQ